MNTSFPILYVANMADNVTPLISARNNSLGFKDSVVLVQNSYGVSSNLLSISSHFYYYSSLPPLCHLQRA